ncbi:DUF3667 domain-containing protein [Niveispirillum fermenti]|uniref:DUF3667 domain-containing protein n=1 Tax=Niveispirillum fermenti TaxID=1233113 RepID=UPI003A86E01D
MSDGFDSVGAMATAGLAAAAIEGESGQHGHAHGACANCGAVLRGNFCHACGQPGHLHRSMLHIVEEFFHGILHFDSKAWRTLPMLIFRPGKLTYDYIHGHRARYVTPLAMFLFTAFLMLMVFSMMGGAGDVPVAVPPTEQAEALRLLEEGLAEARGELREVEADLTAATAAGEQVAVATRLRDSAAERVERAQVALDAYKATLEATGATVTEDKDGKAAGVVTGPSTTLGNLISQEMGKDLKVTIGTKEFQERVKKRLSNPDFLIYKMQNTAYKFSWLLIPISLPFLWMLFFWKRDVAMYDHAIFSLYSLSFMSLLFITVSLLFKFTEGFGDTIGTLLVLAPPVHMFAQLKGTYRLSAFSALWRTVALLFITSMTSLTFVIFIVSMGVAG